MIINRLAVSIPRLLAIICSFPTLLGAAQVSHSSQSIVSDITIEFSRVSDLENQDINKIADFFDRHSLRYSRDLRSGLGANNASIIKADIFAFRKSDIIVNIYTDPMRPRVFHASIKTRPPTVHNTQLEDELVHLVSNDLDGTINIKSTGNNSERSQKTFDLIYKSFVESNGLDK